MCERRSHRGNEDPLPSISECGPSTLPNVSATTHATAPNEFVEVGGSRFAYCRLGPASSRPLLFLQHFTGTMDGWDPLVTDGLAQNRPVIFYDSSGVGPSDGETPDAPTSSEATESQGKAIHAWGQIASNSGWIARLRAFKSATLVVNRNDALMIPTINTYALSQAIQFDARDATRQISCVR